MFPHPLPIARYRFTAIVHAPLQLPQYAGSLLRGQFGAALRQVACMTRQPSCAGCPLLGTCPYSRIFAAPPPPKGSHALQDFSQIPNPYIIEPPAPGVRLLAAGEELVFHMVLIGHAISQLPLVIFALQRALARGLSAQRVPAQLLHVAHVDGRSQAHGVWHHEQPVLQEHDATLRVANPENISDTPENTAVPARSISDAARNGISVQLSIQTPLRLQHQGQPLRADQVTARTLLATLMRRCVLLLELHGGINPADGWSAAIRTALHQAEAVRDVRHLQWFDWERYSSRQQQRMALGGVLGNWTLHMDDAATLEMLWPWLWLGQWLHVGKNTTMGMGGYTLQTAQS